MANVSDQIKKPEIKKGEQICFRYYQEQGIDVKHVGDDQRYFQKGVDIIINEGGSQYFIDVKTDLQAIQYNNAAIELMEKTPKENREGHWKRGWIYSSIDQVDYIIWDNAPEVKMLKMPMKDLYQLTFSEQWKGFAHFHDKSSTSMYHTLGVLIPVPILEKHFESVMIKNEE